MRDLLQSAAIGTACGLLLTMLYVAVKHQWPHNYFYLEASADPVVSRNLPRYVLFRFGPPVLIFGAAAVTADRLAVDPWIAVLVAVIVHSYGLIIAIVRAIRRRERLKLAASRAVIILLLALLGSVAASLRNYIEPIVPTPDDLLSNLWAGALAAVGAVFLQRVALVKHDPLSVALRCTRDIEGVNFRYAAKVAHDAKIPVNLVLLFMIAEDIQRPRWYRRLEAGLPGHGSRTTGIMQQRGARSDRESIDSAVRNNLDPAVSRARDKSLPGESAETLFDRMLEEALVDYSEDPTFHELVRGLAYSLPADERWLQIVRTKMRLPVNAATAIS